MPFRYATTLAAAIAIVLAVSSLDSAPTTHAGEAGPVDVVEQYFAGINSGNVDASVALLADDAILKEVSFVSLLAVGPGSFRPVLGQLVQWNAQGTLSDLEADGNTVTGVVAWTMLPTVEADVDRALQPFTFELNDAGLIRRIDVLADRSDEQTLEYLEVAAAIFDETYVQTPLPGSVIVPLEAQAGGNQPGTASILGLGGISAITVAIAAGAEGVEQPAHFHTGTCATPGPIVHTIASVVDGRSLTVLDVPAAELTRDDLIINVHLSAAEATTYVSCGTVPSPVVEPTPVPATAVPTPPGPSGVVAPSTGTGTAVGVGALRWAAILAVAGVVAVAGALRFRVR